MRKPKDKNTLKPSQVDAHAGNLLDNITEGKKTLELRIGHEVFAQGAHADAIYFIQSGRVKVTVGSGEGQELATAILGPGDFFGEGCLLGQSLRISTVTTLESSTICQIQKQAMLEAIQAQPKLSESFIASLIVRNIDIERDLCQQVFNSDEKRLAHVLLKLDRYGRSDSVRDAKLFRVNHQTLAAVVGTTQAQIMNFLDKFSSLGLIHYDDEGGIVVRDKMLADMVLAV